MEDDRELPEPVVRVNGRRLPHAPGGLGGRAKLAVALSLPVSAAFALLEAHGWPAWIPGWFMRC